MLKASADDICARRDTVFSLGAKGPPHPDSDEDDNNETEISGSSEEDATEKKALPLKHINRNQGESFSCCIIAFNALE